MPAQCHSTIIAHIKDLSILIHDVQTELNMGQPPGQGLTAKPCTGALLKTIRIWLEKQTVFPSLYQTFFLFIYFFSVNFSVVLLNMNAQSIERGTSCSPQDINCTKILESLSAWNDTEANAYRLMELPPIPPTRTSVISVNEASHAFPTVDVPDHAHYTIGVVILMVGITGMLGNFLVIYAFCRSKSLRTPANMFIINLAISDFLMSSTQAPVFFATSLHKRWIFGEKGCELYAFCGALFGITSMITLMVISVDRYFVITRPLASIGMMSKKRAVLILLGVWLYALAWSLPPFFGWSAYVPEGLLTSCTWDYMTFTPSVRAYTMLLFCFVFFIPLSAIIYCYFFIFKAIKTTNKAVQKIGSDNNKESQKQYQRMKNEWKMAKIALIVILLFVISWSPYSIVALMAFAGYANVLTPYTNSVPAVIAKASAIHNPIIYAITHPKYRMAIAKYVPGLGSLLRVSRKDSKSYSSYSSTRRCTVSSLSSNVSGLPKGKRQMTSVSDSESGWTDTEVDISSASSRPASKQTFYEMGKDFTETSDAKSKSKLKSQDSGIYEKTLMDVEDIAMVEVNTVENKTLHATSRPPDNPGLQKGDSLSTSSAGCIPSIVISCSKLHEIQEPSEDNSALIDPRRIGYTQDKKA
uniref:Melanopsin n=1 Tax=Geotrypetes seraphini TaxID=260995 RepID=A0A6P8RBN7_GEOSA|nr:melanopsin [Geotrypetes seraphini]